VSTSNGQPNGAGNSHTWGRLFGLTVMISAPFWLAAIFSQPFQATHLVVEDVRVGGETKDDALRVQHVYELPPWARIRTKQSVQEARQALLDIASDPQHPEGTRALARRD